MSVVSVNESWMERDGAIGLDTTTARRTFLVETDSTSDDAMVVGVATGIPALGSLHPNNSALWVSTITPKPESLDGYNWKVTVGYVPVPPATVGGVASPYPWEMDPVINYGFVGKQKLMEKVYSKTTDLITAALVASTLAEVGVGNAKPARKIELVNSAGLKFDPLPYFDESLLVINIQMAERGTDFNLNKVIYFQNTVNRENIRVAGFDLPALTGYLRDYKATKAFVQDRGFPGTMIPYYQLVIDIVVDPDTWLRRIIDSGLMESTTDSYGYTAWKPILDKDKKKRVLEPVLLDGMGQKLGNPQDPTTHMVHNCHVLYETKWSGLGLPGEVV